MIESGRILPLKVLVKEIKESDKTESGLIIKPVDVMRKKTHAGEVVLVGEGTPDIPMTIQAGDKVLHSPHSFVAVEIDGQDYRLVNYQDILFYWR